MAYWEGGMGRGLPILTIIPLEFCRGGGMEGGQEDSLLGGGGTGWRAENQ